MDARATMKINKISRENKLKVLKIVWVHMKMLFGTTVGQRVCKRNIFFGFSCNFLESKESIESGINNPSLRISCNIMSHQSEILYLKFSNYYQVTKIKANEIHTTHEDKTTTVAS